MRWPFSWRAKTVGEAPRPATPASHRRAPTLLTRSFRAAYPDRLANGFNLFGNFMRAETRQEIRGLVQHSRHAAQNFDYARAYEMLFRRHVIGPNGIRLSMDVKESDGRKDKAANAIIEAGWAKWGKFGSPTICGRLSWWGVECQMATAIAREGGAFLRFHTGRRYGPFGLKVEPIPFDLLDIDLTMPLRGGGYIESGIEFDADGRPMAFHIWSVAMSETHRSVPRRRVRVPASEMIHVLVPEEVGQALGVPRSNTALRLMNMSERFQESAMTAANYGAASMVFFKQADTSGQIGGEAVTDPPIDEIEGGTMALLPPGVEPVPHVPNYPDAQVEPFLRTMATSQAAGLGVAYETLTADLSRANFSSLRAGKGEEREEWEMLQRAIFESLHDRVHSRWLEQAILRGALRLPISNLDKFDAAIWRPRGWTSVNPKDDATANANDLASGAKSLTEIVAERGRSLDDVLDERAAEAEAFRARGLPVPAWAGTPDDGVPGDTEPPNGKAPNATT
ncbi:MAG: phage portal protein [Pseudomonadota bacterium]